MLPKSLVVLRLRLLPMCLITRKQLLTKVAATREIENIFRGSAVEGDFINTSVHLKDGCLLALFLCREANGMHQNVGIYEALVISLIRMTARARRAFAATEVVFTRIMFTLLLHLSL